MRQNFLRPPRTAGEWAADAVRALGVVGVLITVIWWSPMDVGIAALALPGLVIPRLAGVRGWFDLAYGLVVLVATWSNILGLYERVPDWDLVVHFACTGVFAAMLYVLLSRWRIVPEQDDAHFTRRGAVVLVATFGLAVSALWEMVEWVGHTFITTEIFVAYDDTIADMVAGGIGSFVAGFAVAAVSLSR